jgi:hypothetical protein
MNARQFSLSALFIATFWSAVLLATTLAIVRLHSEHEWPPWHLDRARIWTQLFLNLCIGIALGGFIGTFYSQWIRGPLIGLGTALLVDVLCFACLVLMLSGL